MIKFQAKISKLTFFGETSFVTEISLGYAAVRNNPIFNILSHMIPKLSSMDECFDQDFNYRNEIILSVQIMIKCFNTKKKCFG